MVRLLLKRDDVNANFKDNSRRTSLSWATGNGNKAVVRLLLERDNVKANFKDLLDFTPLPYTA